MSEATEDVGANTTGLDSPFGSHTPATSRSGAAPV